MSRVLAWCARTYQRQFQPGFWSFIILVLSIEAWCLINGLPVWANNWLIRPLFLGACVSRAGKADDATLSKCYEGWLRWRELNARGWLPADQGAKQ